MPRKYVRKNPKGTPATAGRPRDEKGRLLPKDAASEAVEAAAERKPVKPATPAPPPPLAAQSVEHALLAPYGLYPSPELWTHLGTMADTILASGLKPGWIFTREQMLTVLLRGYEMRIPATQVIWNTYQGEDGRMLNTAELMRFLVLRSGKGTLRAVRRDNEVCSYEGVRYGRRGDGSDDTTLVVTMHLAELGSAPLKGLPRHTMDAKVTSEICRTLFADVAGGYTPEDFGGAVAASPMAPSPVASPPAAPAAKPAKVKAEKPEKPVPAPEPEPITPKPEPTPAPQPEPTPAPTPAPEQVQTAPAPATPPGANEEVRPGIVAHRLVQAPVFIDGKPTGEMRAVYTAGISGDQIARIQQVAGIQHQEAAQKWLGQRQIKRLGWLTEIEGDELIGYLQGLAGNGETRKPPVELTFERAWELFSQDIGALGLPVEKVAAYLAEKAGVATMRDLLPEQLVAAAEDFKALTPTDLASFKLAFERLQEREGMDPSSGGVF